MVQELPSMYYTTGLDRGEWKLCVGGPSGGTERAYCKRRFG